MKLSAGPNLHAVILRLAGVKSGKAMIGRYASPAPHRNGSAWVGSSWLKSKFKPEYMQAILDGSGVVELSAPKALRILQLLPSGVPTVLQMDKAISIANEEYEQP